MPKILLISWGVFPSTGGSTVIVNNIARAFSKNEMVIVGEKPTVQSKKRWDEDFPNLYYVEPFAEGESKKGIRFRYWGRARRLQKEIEHILKKENCDRLLCIFPNEFYMYLGYRISKKFNIPFYTWFHNTYLDNRRGILKLLANFLQPKFFSHASQNFVMSEGMKNFYVQRYPNYNFKPLVHGFEIPDNPIQEIPKPKELIKFLFSGSINDSCLDATVRLFKYLATRKDAELHVYSGNGAILKQLGIESTNIIIHDFIPLKEFEKKLELYDIMLLPHGFEGMRTEAEYKTIFPTRTIPLLYSNRPILAHSPPGAFLTDFLKNHDCAEVVEEKSIKAIELAIDKLVNDVGRRNILVANAMQTARMFDLNNVAKLIKTEME